MRYPKLKFWCGKYRPINLSPLYITLATRMRIKPFFLRLYTAHCLLNGQFKAEIPFTTLRIPWRGERSALPIGRRRLRPTEVWWARPLNPPAGLLGKIYLFAADILLLARDLRFISFDFLCVKSKRCIRPPCFGYLL